MVLSVISVDTVNPQHQKSDASLVYSLIQELYSKAESTEEFSTKAKLQDAAVKFQVSCIIQVIPIINAKSNLFFTEAVLSKSKCAAQDDKRMFGN